MLTKSPEIEGQCHNNIWFCESARQAFRSILLNKKTEGRKILMPGYIGITDREGSGVFDPVSSTQTAYEFYRLDRELSMDKTQVAELIESGQFFAILIIHYFGFCQTDMAWLIRLCKDNDVMIIEDCAHTLNGSTDVGILGHMGQLSIYALHKILSSSTGGMMRQNTSSAKYNPLELQLPDASVLNALLTTDLDNVKSIRIRNYNQWLSKINEIEGITPVYDKLPNGICPHNLPILISDGLREKLYFKLVDAGVPVVALYYRMIPELPQEGFEDAYYVSQNILNLPVHQDITLEDIDLMANELHTAACKLWTNL